MELAFFIFERSFFQAFEKKVVQVPPPAGRESNEAYTTRNVTSKEQRKKETRDRKALVEKHPRQSLGQHVRRED